MAIIVLIGLVVGSEVSVLSPFLTTELFGDYYGILLQREQALLAASSPMGAVCMFLLVSA